ncbi:MAG TPA: response regulator [Kofleriaceae bacterium]|nr:response regulator [Kofleriaceae bacterium]
MSGDDRTRLLMVDPYYPTRWPLAEVLRQEGYEVSEASGATEALQRLVDVQPHAVLCEVELPDAPGCEAIRMMRAASAGCLVIAVTHCTSIDRLAPAFAAGATSCVIKPVQVARLISVLPEPRGRAWPVSTRRRETTGGEGMEKRRTELLELLHGGDWACVLVQRESLLQVCARLARLLDPRYQDSLAAVVALAGSNMTAAARAWAELATVLRYVGRRGTLANRAFPHDGLRAACGSRAGSG